MLLAVTNESSIVTSADLEKLVSACAMQLKWHVAPAWDMIPASIILCEHRKSIPRDADILTIMDDSDKSGCLGYHLVAPDGRPYLRVFVNPILTHGGEILTTSLSVSAVVSHEACEWFVNRFLNLWAEGPDGHYALEICDPVADDTYEIDCVSVSDFVYKRFFDARAPSTCQFDHLRKVTAPLTVRFGGQMQVRTNGKLHVVREGFGPDR